MSAPSGQPTGPSASMPSYPSSGQSTYPGPAPAPGQYGAPQGGSDSTKMLSLVSMGTGIAGIVLCCCWGLPIFSIIALITGYIAEPVLARILQPPLTALGVGESVASATSPIFRTASSSKWMPWPSQVRSVSHPTDSR